MSDEQIPPLLDERPRGGHLRLVQDMPIVDHVRAGDTARPRTIGRLIAQTALIAESASNRRREFASAESNGVRGMAGRLLGRRRSQL